MGKGTRQCEGDTRKCERDEVEYKGKGWRRGYCGGRGTAGKEEGGGATKGEKEKTGVQGRRSPIEEGGEGECERATRAEGGWVKQGDARRGGEGQGRAHLQPRLEWSRRTKVGGSATRHPLPLPITSRVDQRKPRARTSAHLTSKCEYFGVGRRPKGARKALEKRR